MPNTRRKNTRPRILQIVRIRYDSVESVLTDARLGTRNYSAKPIENSTPTKPLIIIPLFFSACACLRAAAEV